MRRSRTESNGAGGVPVSRATSARHREQLGPRHADADRDPFAGDRPLFIKSDVATSYGRVVQVINSARDSGFQKIGLLVDREKQQERIF